MTIGKNIKMLRNKYGLSQKELASIAGVSDKAVSTWENNLKEPRMGTIQKIADHFGLQKSNIIEDNGLESITSLSSQSALPALTPKDEHQIAKDLENMINSLSGAAAMGNPEDAEDVAMIKASLETAMRLSKRIAKKKYTPKKYQQE
jgi:transcriptional regulator with XRE-family HTH domain